MKINYLKINGFGKLENKEINLENNINLIYGKNEAGKTTLLKFIAGMFYGISKNKNKKEVPDFERYKPWNNQEFSGKIKYTLDNNTKFEVFRDFSKKNPKIYNEEGEDISKNFNIDKTKGNEFFFEQTKIDESMFFSTTLIEQKAVVLDNSEQSVLTQKIANILSTGEENTSYKKTMEKLNKKIVEEVGTERTVGRPLNIVNEKINKIKQEKNDLEINNIQINELEQKKENIKNKIKEKEIKIDLIKKIRKIKDDSNLEEEKIKVNNNIIKEEENKISNLQDKSNENKINKKESNLIDIIILSLLMIINIVLFNFKANKIINIVLLCLTIILAIFIAIKKIKSIKLKKERNKIEQDYLAEIEKAKNNIETIQKNINKINEEAMKKNELEKSKIKNTYKDEIDKNEIEYLFNENSNEINSILENLENEISTAKLQLHTNEIDYNNIVKKLEEKSKLEEQLQNSIEEREEILKLEKSINLAKEALENAYKKMKEEITPKFTKNLSKIVEKISRSKYSKTKFIDGEGLIVELENGEYVNSNRLSIGTIDQLYLALRLSAMQEITEENMPVILDEVFAYYDTERLSSVLKFLHENYKENQIIIFTCSSREKEILDKSGIEYNYIEI